MSQGSAVCRPRPIFRLECYCRPYHPVQIEICLRETSPENGNIWEFGPETFNKFSLRLRQFGVWRPSEKREKAPILQGFRDYGAIYL